MISQWVNIFLDSSTTSTRLAPSWILYCILLRRRIGGAHCYSQSVSNISVRLAFMTCAYEPRSLWHLFAILCGPSGAVSAGDELCSVGRRVGTDRRPEECGDGRGIHPTQSVSSPSTKVGRRPMLGLLGASYSVRLTLRMAIGHANSSPIAWLRT